MKKLISMMSLALMCMVSVLVLSSCSQDDDIQDDSNTPTSEACPFDQADYEAKLKIMNTYNPISSIEKTRGGIYVQAGFMYIRFARPQIRILQDQEMNGKRYAKAVAYPVEMELSTGHLFTGRLFFDIISDKRSTVIRYYNRRERISTIIIYGDLYSHYSHGSFSGALYSGLYYINGYCEKQLRWYNLPNGITGFSISTPDSYYQMERWVNQHK